MARQRRNNKRVITATEIRRNFSAAIERLRNRRGRVKCYAMLPLVIFNWCSAPSS